MVIAMVLTLLLCRSPTIILWVLWSFALTIKIFFDSSSSSFVRRFHHLANLIAILNAATNFLPFCVFGQIFRAECLTIYCCRKATQQIRRNHDENPQQVIMKKTPPIIEIQRSTTCLQEHLRLGNSETTSGILSISRRPMIDVDGTRLPSTTTPLLQETIGL